MSSLQKIVLIGITAALIGCSYETERHESLPIRTDVEITTDKSTSFVVSPGFDGTVKTGTDTNYKTVISSEGCTEKFRSRSAYKFFSENSFDELSYRNITDHTFKVDDYTRELIKVDTWCEYDVPGFK